MQGIPSVVNGNRIILKWNIDIKDGPASLSYDMTHKLI